MQKNITDAPRTLPLRSGGKIPTIGLGTSRMNGKEEEATLRALETGYRHIDTAKMYGTEEGIGRALKKTAVPRSEIFITTKLLRSDQGYDGTLAAIDESLKKLQLEYVDLYLIHWPVDDAQTRAKTWRAMERILESGKAKAIGVSNYDLEYLVEMESYASVPPAVNQIQRHPFHQEIPTADYCDVHGIVITNYSPLTRGARPSDPTMEKIAKRHGRTTAQIFLRWGLQHGNVVIPKAAQKAHIEENFNVFDFSLSDEDMTALDGLNEDLSVI